MIFDVIIREGFNDKGKQIINVFRIHDTSLSAYLRSVQDKGGYIISVIPLFRKKEEPSREVVEAIKQFKKELTGMGIEEEND